MNEENDSLKHACKAVSDNYSDSSSLFDVTSRLHAKEMGKRIHLCEYETDSLADGLNSLFNRYVEISRIKHGKRQTLDTLITEEALLLARFLRNEQKEWLPRIVIAD